MRKPEEKKKKEYNIVYGLLNRPILNMGFINEGRLEARACILVSLSGR